MRVLSSPEVSKVFAKNYVSAHVDFGEIKVTDPAQDMVERHNKSRLRPVLVFLDAQGKEVARHSGGLKSTEEALLLDRYVSEKHYRGTSFPAFKAARRG